MLVTTQYIKKRSSYMNYTETNTTTQEYFVPECGVLFFDSGIPEFKQTEIASSLTKHVNFGTRRFPRIREIKLLVFSGILDISSDKLCPKCAKKMVKNGSLTVTLNHVPIGEMRSLIRVSYPRLRCLNNDCSFSSWSPKIPFKDKRHRITRALKDYTISLLEWGMTLKTAAFITGLDKMTVKSIHKELLKKKFTVNDKLIKPERQANYLAIDEFKLHNGYKYATVIIDLETGHILYLAHGKKKAVVYDFIKHVGQEWMAKVKAVSCDMNSNFEEAFKEKCPAIDIVYDHFHIIKNFNDKVVTAVRKDEQRRLIEEGKDEEAAHLKKTKYIFMSKRSTLIQKDNDASAGKLVSKAGQLFNKPEFKAKGGNEDRYENLLEENKLFFTIDFVKEQLDEAYKSTNEVEMCVRIQEIIDICKDTNNNRFSWFARLLENHLQGIYTFARYHISTGKLEGINNKIKTERRQGYGYPDDEYFFLRLMECSRKKTRY